METVLDHRNDASEQSPQPSFRRRVLVFLGALALAAGLAASAYVFWAVWIPPSTRARKGDEMPAIFRVRPGEDTKTIARNLKQQGYIKNASIFSAYTRLTKTARRLRAGNYRLERGMTLPRIAAILASDGALPEDTEVTLPEGLTAEQMGGILDSHNITAKTDFLKLAADPPPDLIGAFPSLVSKPPRLPLEGYLFPDTYRFGRYSAPRAVMERLLRTFEEKTAMEIWSIRPAGKHTLHETLTMASLIEKEVPGTRDRRIVSGILWKRLEIGMPLQVDATVAFTTLKHTTQLSRADLETPSPYNTYLHRGLPPGPIANPGLDAIRAALQPESSDHLYYLSTPTGQTVFSRTLAEHNAAKIRYLR